MSENAQKPRIRFKGFSDAWEQRKLGDTTQIIMGQSPDGSTYSDFPTDYILVQGNADLENGWVKPRIWTTQKTKYAVAGDLIMSVRAPAGSMGKTAYNVVLGRGVAAIKGNEFIFQVLTKMDLEGFWKKLSAGSTFESLNSDNIINANINLPSNLEQDKIGSLFEKIDNLITLHQRECFYIYKKYLLFLELQNSLQMNYSWEQRKVTELGKIYIGLVTTMTKHYTDEGTLLIRNSDIKDGKFEFGENPIYLEKDFAQKNESRMHQIGDVITVHTGDVGTSAVITKNEDKSIGFATIVTRPNTKIIDANYLCTFLNTDKHKKWAVSISTGDGRTNYNLGDYYELYVPIPKLDEQKHIATYIQNLSNLITLHQRKVFSHILRFLRREKLSFLPISWEQRKLGELVDVCSGRDYKHLSEGTIPVYGTGGYMLSVNDALSYDRDAIGIGRKGTIDRPYILKAPFWTVDTLFYAIPREKVDLNFAFDIFQNIDWKKKDESTGVPSLSKTAINDIDVLAPKHGEQQTIGQFFAAIDHLITLHQRKGKAAVSGCFLNCSSLEKSSAQSRTLELFGQTSNQEIKYIIDGLSILGGKLRNFCVKLIILLSYTRINDIAKYHISRNTECVHNIN